MTPSNKSEPKQKPSTIAFEAIGTIWNIDIFDALDTESLSELQVQITDRIKLFDMHYSRFRSDSWVAAIAESAGNYTMPTDAIPLFNLYKELYDITKGAMTPLIGQTLSDAGYDENYSLIPKKVTIAPDWESTVSYTHKTLHVSKPVLLDFGAVGKGYLVDIISEVIASQGVRNFCVSAGGDMAYRTDSKDGLQIALEHPDEPSLALGVATIYNQSICGSSGAVRKWGDYTHIIDARTGLSPKHIKAVWVVSESCMLSDGLTTALYFAKPEILQSTYSFEYAIINNDDSLDYSTNFPAEFFTA